MSFEIQVEGDFATSRSFILHPTNFARSFTFRATDNADMLRWFYSISKAIDTSNGFRRSLTNLFSEKKFWKFDRLSIKQLIKTAESGDILLFTSKQTHADMQRIFTGSKYDHVALLIVSNPQHEEKRQVYVFEATGGEGVSVTNLMDFKTNKWYLLYTRLVIRKLNYKRETNFFEKLQEFFKKTHGKKYSISAQKLLKKQSMIAQDEDFKDRAFFCSELVAAAYKRLGLLPNDISSTQYWPGSFSSEYDLPLQSCSLGQEILIDFQDAEN
eukprot:TRINITY_DN3923_c0_g2_i8.p1 TRINITY_DN3923_c0_g2~~TRINITY_DN3923_c0_g2_i8.p1  ORF type:complete len:270 (-),score=51.24 TRINITY_DN3923_c0_g2_i8:114-923(-)